MWRTSSGPSRKTTGTTTAPRRLIAAYAWSTSGQLGSITTTRSSAAMPRRRSAFASRLAARCWSTLVSSRPSNVSATYSPYVSTLCSPSVARFTDSPDEPPWPREVYHRRGIRVSSASPQDLGQQEPGAGGLAVGRSPARSRRDHGAVTGPSDTPRMSERTPRGGAMPESHYVLIESRDPFESGDSRFVPDTAAALRARGHAVTIFLVQNGVFGSRIGARGSELPRLARAGVSVLADDFSLRERGIDPGEIAPGVREATIDTLVDLVMGPTTKTLWH